MKKLPVQQEYNGFEISGFMWKVCTDEDTLYISDKDFVEKANSTYPEGLERYILSCHEETFGKRWEQLDYHYEYTLTVRKV